MVFAWFTNDEAIHLRDTCMWPTLREKLERQLAGDLIPYDCEPRTVILRDEGDGLRMIATSYDNEKAADRAFDAHWLQLKGTGGLLPPVAETTRPRSRWRRRIALWRRKR